MSADENESRPEPGSRAVPVLLAMAFAITVATATVSWFAVETSHSNGPGTAERLLWLQRANLALIALSVVVFASALAMHVRGAAAGERWVTICAWTRRVRWRGRWVTFEEYLSQQFNLRCTHGICDEEAEKLRRN